MVRLMAKKIEHLHGSEKKNLIAIITGQSLSVSIHVMGSETC